MVLGGIAVFTGLPHQVHVLLLGRLNNKDGVINQFLEAIKFQAVIDVWNRAAGFLSGAIDGFWFVLTGAAAGVSLAIPALPWQMMQTDFAVYVGIVYTYLPFMILPLYTTLVKLDVSLFEASADLGARPARTFLSVTLPLSMPGIIAGSMLVFIPAIGEFVIPSLLGGPGTLMIGRVLWDEFFANTNWPRASAL